AVDRLDEVLAEGLGPVVEEEVLALDHARQTAQARELVLQAVLPLDSAHEDTVFLAAVVRFLAHRFAPSSTGLLRRLPTLAENLFVQVRPLVVFVERDSRVDELERQLVERRVDFPARRHEVALREYLLALLADLEVVEEHRGVRMRGAARDADSVRPRDRRADREPVDRRALALELFGLVIVYGQRERHLTRHDQLREQRMPLAHRHAVFCDDLLEEFRAPGLADFVEKAREPVRVLLLDTEFPLPL